MANLSTVIGRGLAAAKPGSPTAGYLYYSTDLGIMERYSGSAWEQVSHSGIAFTFDTTVTDSDPGAGAMRFDNATPASATFAYLDDTCLGSDADLGVALAALDGAVVLFQQLGSDAKYILATIGTPTDGTGYWKLPLTIAASGTLPDNGAVVQLLIFGGGGGTAATVNWWDKPTAAIHHALCHRDAQYTTGFYGDNITLTTGTAAFAAVVGTGGFTEVEVACTLYADTSPVNGNYRGIRVGDIDARADIGHYARVIARFPVHADQDLFVGLANNSWGSSNVDQAGFYLAAAGTNWFAHSADGTTLETTDTGVAWGANDWHVFEVYVYDNAGTMTTKFWIDGTLVATHTTNCPTATQTALKIQVDSLWMSADVTTNDMAFFVAQTFWATQDSEVISNLGFAVL